MRDSTLLALAFFLFALGAGGGAFAQTAGTSTVVLGCNFPGATKDYAGNPCPPLACDGGLCATDNSTGCGAVGGGSIGGTLFLAAVTALGLAFARLQKEARR